MRSGTKACWKTILLQSPGGAGAGAVSRSERLAALYRFQNGEAPGDLHLVDPLHETAVTDPADIDWDRFPFFEALEAVTHDELRRLRSLLAADAAAMAPPLPPVPPPGLVWGVDIRSEA